MATRSRQAWPAAVLLALAMLPSSLPVAAAEAMHLPGHGVLQLDAYATADGLSQSAVTALASDDQDLLWIGTQDGLNRFDGHRFQVQRLGPAEAGGLASSSIDAMAFDPGHRRLWLGTNDAGLEVVDLPGGRHWRLGTGAGLSHSQVGAIALDPRGGAWLGTGAGIDRVEPTLARARPLGATGTIVALETLPGDTGHALGLGADCRLWRAAATTLQPLPAPAGAEAGGCVGLAVSAASAWVAHARAGLFRIDPADGRVLARHDPHAGGLQAPVSAIGLLPDERLLVGYQDGRVALLDEYGVLRPQRLEDGPDSAITRFFVGPSGSVWIGAYTSGLFRVRAANQALRGDVRAGFEPTTHWPSRSLRSLWLEGLPQLVGSDAGLLKRSRADGPWEPVPAFAGMSVRVLRPAAGGGWWVGTHAGLWRWDGADHAEAVAGLPDPKVEDLLVEGRTVWVATRGGLARLEHEAMGAMDTVAAAPELAPLRGQLLTSLQRDAGGDLWIGSNADGLWRIGGDGVPRRFHPAGTSMHDSVWSLHADRRGLWAGTYSGGLYRIDPGNGHSRRWTTADGLSNDTIYRILPDAAGRLWLSTNNGLSVLDPGSGIVQTLGRRDGLRNTEFNSGAAVATRDGLLYFGGIAGVDVIDPAGLPARSPPARPLLTVLRTPSRLDDPVQGLRETGIVYADAIALDHRDSLFTIAMAALDFTAPDAARLRYRLDGVHADWVHPPAPHAELTLSQLPPGRYTLQVQAAGRDGQFGPSRTLRIDMAPPPWRHPAALAAYLATGIALLAWLGLQTRARFRRERERSERLDRLVAERTVQLEDANRRLREANAALDADTRLDPLTRVSNRRDLHDWLGRREAAAQAQGRPAPAPLYFFMVDIDDFKQVNDRHGHGVGDEVLVQFAERLRQLCRDDDLVVRWGGEEFLVVSQLPRAEGATHLAERLRAAVAGQPLPVRDGALALTCSVGFAPWPLAAGQAGLWEQSVDLADRCLYLAKHSGKDTWVGVAADADAEAGALEALLQGRLDLGDAGGVVRLLRPGTR